MRLVTGKDGQRRADPAGKLARTLRYQYDANGRLTGITQPGNLTARFEYDAAGRLAQRILPDGGRIAIARDSEDRIHDIAAYADAAGNAISRIAYGYDDLNRITQIGDGEGVFNRYRHTGLGQIAAATNALGMETQLTWDDSGLPTFKTQASRSPSRERATSVG